MVMRTKQIATTRESSMNKRNPIGMPRIARSGLPVLAAPLTSAVLALLACSGCQQQPDQPGYVGNAQVGADIFSGVDDDARSVNRVVTVQTANAARTDATLRHYH